MDRFDSEGRNARSIEDIEKSIDALMKKMVQLNEKPSVGSSGAASFAKKKITDKDEKWHKNREKKSKR